MRIAVVLGGLLALASASARAAPRPNIVIILADDLGYSDLASYGGEIDTPNLDRLAANGVRFTQFYVTPRCSPTRAALLTGLYPHEAGLGHLNRDWHHPGYRGELSPQAVTIPEVLAPAGYSSYMAGKWHLAHNPRPSRQRRSWPLQRGFERFYGTIRGSGSYFEPPSLVRDDSPIEPKDADYYYTDAISEHAARFIQEHADEHPGQPFFLYVAYTAPHWPLHARQEEVAKYAGRYDAGWDAMREERYQRMREQAIFEENWPLSPRDASASPWEEVGHKPWQARRMETYAAMVDRLDQGVGRVLAALSEVGFLEETLLLFLSDNGASAEALSGPYKLGRYFMPLPQRTIDGGRLEFGDDPTLMPGPDNTFQSVGPGWAALSNTPFRLHKHRTHEGGIATPLIVHWPAGLGVEPGSLIREPGHVVDIMATLLDLSGAAYPRERKGHSIRPLRGDSLLPLLQGGSRERGAMFWEHEGNRAVRHGRWKLVSRWLGPWELYDLEADRTELHNLAQEEPERVGAMEAMYEEWARSAQVEAWPLVVPFVSTLLWAAVLGTLLGLTVAFRRLRRRHSAGQGES